MQKFSRKLDFHWFSVDQRGFAVSGPRIHAPHVALLQKNMFPVNLISIGSWSTNRVSRCFDHGFMFPTSRFFRKKYFQRTRFSLVPGRPMGFRGVSTPNSCSPHQDTSEKLVSGVLDFHWFSVDQWGFEVFGPRIRVPRIQLPLVASRVLQVCFLDGNVLLTRLQTDRHTIIYSVRPSFQSREQSIDGRASDDSHEINTENVIQGTKAYGKDDSSSST